MLLASNPSAPRSLHCEVHMEEPNTKQQHQSAPLVQKPEEPPIQNNTQETTSDDDCVCEASSKDTTTRQKCDHITGPQVDRPQAHASVRACNAPISSEDEVETETTETPKVRVPATPKIINNNAIGATSLETGISSDIIYDDASSYSQGSREDDDREYSKEKGPVQENGQIQSHRQSPSPSPSFPLSSSITSSISNPGPSAGLARPIKSAMKRPEEGSKKKTKGKNYRTRRRIRGLWNDDTNCHFSELHDETMLKIMSYLNMKDLCITSMVCQRWKHLSLHQNSWKRIDATEFVVQAHRYYSVKEGLPQAKAAKMTSLALVKRTERYTPFSLSIHSIGKCLSADNFLSSLPGLQELSLTSFSELTDTHIHVLLLSSSCLKNGVHAANRSKRSCVLRKLVLEYCPRLTDATVQSIGRLCPDLEELSLFGCPHIKDLTALQDLWTLCHKPVPKAKVTPSPLTSLFPLPPGESPATPPSKPPPPSLVNSNLTSLFGGPPPSTPPQSSTPPTSSALTNLFAPPGHSPLRTQAVVTLSRPLSKGRDQKTPGSLARINISNTGVTAEALIDALKHVGSSSSSSSVQLGHLIMAGSGESWNDSLLKELAHILNMQKLQVLDISCSKVEDSSTSAVTDVGLNSILEKAANLKELHLMGHAGLSLGDILLQHTISFMPTLVNLQKLNLDGCKGISAKSTTNPMTDLKRIDALSNALGSMTLQGNSSSNTLRCLSLAHCFSNQEQLQGNPDLLAHEECLGQELLKSLTNAGSKKKCKTGNTNNSVCNASTLRELDLRGNWFVTTEDVKKLRHCCPEIETIHLKGTRAAAATATSS